MWRGGSARDGFTLFESVIALMIIGIVAVSTLSTVAAQLRAQERSKRTAEVETLAQDRFAALQMLTGQELQSIPDSVARGRFPVPLHDYSWTALSRPVIGEEYLYDVAVAIHWSGGSFTLYSRIYQVPQMITTEAQ